MVSLCARHMLFQYGRVCNALTSCRLTFHKDLANQVRLLSFYREGQHRVTAAWGHLIQSLGLRVSGFPLQITLQMAPYHFCGLRGNTALAAYLHSRGVSPDRPFQIASFSANGATDGSPWAKAIVVSPQETALLAGVRRTHATAAGLPG